MFSLARSIFAQHPSSGCDMPHPPMVKGGMLTLSAAIKTGRLREFIAQEEARGIGPIERAALDAEIKRLATTPLKSKGRTSRSSSGGGSTEK